MEQFVTPALASRLHRLGHRTHSLTSGESPDTIIPADISGDQWWPERIIKLTRWPGGDIGVNVVDRKTRQARLSSPKRSTGTLSDEDNIRATRRARRRIWNGCQRINANCMLTIAKRGGFADIDELWTVTELIVTEMKKRGWIVGHLTVPEIHDGSRSDGLRHGANLGTWHGHVATHRPGFFDFKEMHELVRLVESRHFGNDAWNPAERLISVNVNKRPNGKRHTPATTARYLVPYVAKHIESSPRELHRKRFDISRRAEKPQEITIRCNPSETSSPEEIANQLLHRLAPGRMFTTPFAQEFAGVKFWQQSAIDWGVGPEPEWSLQLPSVEVLWTLIPKPTDGRPAAAENSEQPGWLRANELAEQVMRERRHEHHRAQPDRRGGRVDGGQRTPPPAPQPSSESQLWATVQPWVDWMEAEDAESTQP